MCFLPRIRTLFPEVGSVGDEASVSLCQWKHHSCFSISFPGLPHVLLVGFQYSSSTHRSGRLVKTGTVGSFIM